jgi:TonB family protein
MEKLFLLVVIFMSPLILYSQKIKLKKVMYINTEILKQEYQILKKKRYIKNGYYKSYYKNGQLEENGSYENNKRIDTWTNYNIKGEINRIRVYNFGKLVSDKKIGIWEEFLENGQVVKRFDHDKNKALRTIINIQIKYPPLAREHGIEGVVKIKIELSEDCKIIEMKIIKALSKDCDNEALRAVEKFAKLMERYDKDNCQIIDEIIPVKFKLE